jgi:hypothetical protein
VNGQGREKSTRGIDETFSGNRAFSGCHIGLSFVAIPESWSNRGDIRRNKADFCLECQLRGSSERSSVVIGQGRQLKNEFITWAIVLDTIQLGSTLKMPTFQALRIID